MNNKHAPVNIIGVDSSKLEKDGTFPGAYAFYIKLSDNPSHLWQRYLAKWNNALQAMRMKVDVIEDRMRVVFVYGDNVQNCVSYISQLVKLVNENIIEYSKKAGSSGTVGLGKQEERRRKEEELLQQLRQMEPEPVPEAMEVTIEEMVSAYENNEKIADASFRNRLLKITGSVNRLEVRDAVDIRYVTLCSSRDSSQSVWCMFDQGDEDKLKQLREGQTVTIQGKFDGSMVQLRLRHCILISPG